MTKVCTKCGKEKDTSEYYIRTDHKTQGHLYSMCKICHSKVKKAWRNRNKEKCKKYGEVRRLRPYYKKYHKRYRKINRELRNKKAKERYQKNKKEILIKHKEYNKKNKDKIRKRWLEYVKRTGNGTWRWSKEYHKWRHDIYKKYNYTCQDCGRSHCQVIAHHIKSAKDFPELRYDLNNGICLCEQCHHKIHYG